MFERFTDQAIKVIMLAQDESRRLGHNFVGTEQILLGLIGEGQGIAARVLSDMNVRLEHARTQVEQIIGRGSESVAEEIPFTPRAARVLQFSVKESELFGHDYIGTEHLLLGLVQEGEGVANRVLSILGIELGQLRQKVLQQIEQPLREPQLLSDKILEQLQTNQLSLSEGATKALLLAQEETQRAQFDFLGTEQILLGLLAESVGWAAQLLKPYGITLKTARATVKLIVGNKTGITTASLLTPFSPKAEEVLQSAIAHAKDRNHSLLDTAHLLLGLIDQSESVAIQVLERSGIDQPELRSSTLKCLANPHLGQRSSPEAQLLYPIQQKIQEALHSPQPIIQQQALNALAVAGSEIDVAAIIPILQTGALTVRIAAIAALEAIGGSAALTALSDLTQESDPRIRWRAEQAIAQIENGEPRDRSIPLPTVDPNSNDLVQII